MFYDHSKKELPYMSDLYRPNHQIHVFQMPGALKEEASEYFVSILRKSSVIWCNQSGANFLVHIRQAFHSLSLSLNDKRMR